MDKPVNFIKFIVAERICKMTWYMKHPRKSF